MTFFKFLKNNLSRLLIKIIPDTEELSKKDLISIRKIISEKYSTDFFINKIIADENARSYDKSRSFFIVILSNGNKEVSVFVKSQKYLHNRTGFVKRLSQLNLPIPSFYGDFMRNGNIFSLWKYYPSERIRGFSNLDDLILAKIARSVAVFNVNGVKGQILNNLENGCLWAEPITDSVSKKFKLPDNAKVKLRLISKFENYLLSILNSKCHYFLNHNDIKEDNIIIEYGKGRVLLVDLDTLSYGPLGVSLRKLSTLPINKRKVFIKYYTFYLREMDVYVCDKYIHQMMLIQQVFWGLHTGIAFNQLRRIEQTLELFKNNFTVKDNALIINDFGPVRKVKPPIILGIKS